MSRAKYASEVDRGSFGRAEPIIYVIDEGVHEMSVTNDAEAVVAEVVAKYGNYHIVYRDSDGRWDELRQSHGVFLEFACINTRSLADALTAVRARLRLRQGAA